MHHGATMATASTAHAGLAPIAPEASPRVRTALLACGILSSLVYVANMTACAFVWTDYSSMDQTISELSAIDAPSRSTWVPIGTLYAALLIAFGIGVWKCARDNRRLRVAAALLLAMGAVPYWPPMHMRGHAASLTDVLHASLGAVVSMVMFTAVGLAMTALGKSFRNYSIATVGVIVAAAAGTFAYAPRLAANLPTPGMGLIERIDLGAWLLWIAVLAVALMRRMTDVRSNRTSRA